MEVLLRAISIGLICKFHRTCGSPANLICKFQETCGSLSGGKEGCLGVLKTVINLGWVGEGLTESNYYRTDLQVPWNLLRSHHQPTLFSFITSFPPLPHFSLSHHSHACPVACIQTVQSCFHDSMCDSFSFDLDYDLYSIVVDSDHDLDDR